MSPFLYPPPDIRQPVIIREDGGGLVDKYIEQAHQYALQGRRVEIRGSCRSACLLALSVPKVCVVPGARVMAHHAYELDSGKIRIDITNQMLAELPVNIKNRLEGRITVDYSPESTLVYSDLRRLGIPDCDGKRKVAASDDIEQPRKVRIKILNPLEAIFCVFSGANQ
jgi:hypothetical protein